MAYTPYSRVGFTPKCQSVGPSFLLIPYGHSSDRGVFAKLHSHLTVSCRSFHWRCQVLAVATPCNNCAHLLDAPRVRAIPQAFQPWVKDSVFYRIKYVSSNPAGS